MARVVVDMSGRRQSRISELTSGVPSSLAIETPERGDVTAFSSLSSSMPTAERLHPAAAATRQGRPVTTFVLLFAAAWVALYTAYVLLPFVRPGSIVIADAKFDTLVKGNLFGPQDRNRVMLFGHSKVLTSVIPRELDALVGPGFRSYNLGLPGESQVSSNP